MENEFPPGSTVSFSPKVTVDISHLSIDVVLMPLFGSENINRLTTFLEKRGLIPISITECAKWDGRDRYIIDLDGKEIKTSLYIVYNSVHDDLRCGLYTESELIKDSQYRSDGLYGQNHPSGHRLWGWDDESIYMKNDETDEFCLCIQDEEELYDAVIALCIEYYRDNKERIEKERLPTDV